MKTGTKPALASKPETNRNGKSVMVDHHSRASHFATLLSAKVQPMVRDGKKLYEIPVAITGSWVKQGQRFSITPDDLAAMVRNFSKRKNEQVVIDYEHASETPEVALGGPVPAAGWIHEIILVSPDSFLAKNGTRSSAEGAALNALIEWTAEAGRLIQAGQYRFFSPAIDWSCRDKETGQPQGATLTSGALTNHPFLEELPPIMLTDLSAAHKVSWVAAGDRTPIQDRPPTRRGEGGSNLKKLSIKKLDDGDLAGHHGIYDGSEAVGYLDSGDFSDYVKQCVARGDFDDMDGDASQPDSTRSPSATLSERILASRLGMPGASLEELRQRIALAESAQIGSVEAGRRLLLREAVKEGSLDSAKAAVLAREGKITLDDYIAAQVAEKRLDDAVRAGKILPRDRKFFFRDALERPQEFSEYTRCTVPAVRLGSAGLGSAGELNVDDEVRMRTRQAMAEENLSYSKALRKVFASDRELEQRYHQAHRREVGATANAGVDGAGSGIAE